jgi:hypothetical protein
VLELLFVRIAARSGKTKSIQNFQVVTNKQPCLTVYVALSFLVDEWYNGKMLGN